MTVSKPCMGTMTPLAANRAQNNIARTLGGLKSGAITSQELGQIKSHASEVLAMREQFMADGSISVDERAQLQKAVQAGTEMVKGFLNTQPTMPVSPAVPSPASPTINILT